MKTKFGVLTMISAVVLTSVASFAAEPPPPWAYGFTEPPPPGGAPAAAPGGRGAGRGPAAAPDETLKHLQGSEGAFTSAQIRAGFGPPGPADWFPGDHPKMPDIVANGKQPDVRACALCHYPNGKGRPENAGIAGQPVSYFIQTMHDFRDGMRKSADSRKANTNRMIS